MRQGFNGKAERYGRKERDAEKEIEGEWERDRDGEERKREAEKEEGTERRNWALPSKRLVSPTVCRLQLQTQEGSHLGGFTPGTGLRPTAAAFAGSVLSTKG